MYAYKVMNLTSESDSNEPGDTIEALISEITVKLIRLGKFLNDSAKVNLSTQENNLLIRYLFVYFKIGFSV